MHVVAFDPSVAGTLTVDSPFRRQKELPDVALSGKPEQLRNSAAVRRLTRIQLFWRDSGTCSVTPSDKRLLNRYVAISATGSTVKLFAGPTTPPRDAHTLQRGHV